MRAVRFTAASATPSARPSRSALATQTARATNQIIAIRESTNAAVEAVRDVGSAISGVAQVATAIAAEVGVTAGTMRSEVATFLSAMKETDSVERRA